MPRYLGSKHVIFLAIAMFLTLLSQSVATPANAATAFNLPAAVAPTSVKAGSSINIETVFTSVSAGTAVYTLDTEVFKGTTRVAQWTRDWTVKTGERKRVTQSWNTGSLAAGTYSIKTGVFKGWSNNLAWRGDAGQVTISGATTQSTPTTTTPGNNTPSKASSGNTSAPSGSFFVDPSNQALVAANNARNSGNYGDADVLSKLGNTPTAIWLGGWSGDPKATVNNKVSAATAKGQTPIFVAYNIPYRDCGSHSAGGASSADAYRSYINSIAQGISGRKAVVIVEPDALPGLDCLSTDQQNERYSLIRYAVDTLSTYNTAVYVDAGNFTWKTADVMAQRLRNVDIDAAAGFSLNVSGYEGSPATANYGDQLSVRIGKHYIIDTSRNGNDANGEWCNPYGRHVGSYPTTNTGRANADAYLWIKQPGESDGYCNGGPGAGQFWNQRAVELGR